MTIEKKERQMKDNDKNTLEKLGFEHSEENERLYVKSYNDYPVVISLDDSCGDESWEIYIVDEEGCTEYELYDEASSSLDDLIAKAISFIDGELSNDAYKEEGVYVNEDVFDVERLLKADLEALD